MLVDMIQGHFIVLAEWLGASMRWVLLGLPLPGKESS